VVRSGREISARGGATYDGDLVANHFNFRSPEVAEGDNTGEAGAIEEISRIRKSVDCQAEVPYLQSFNLVVRELLSEEI
jgi:hypothetical protein